MLVPVIESFVVVLPEELQLYKGEQMDKNMVEKQEIKNNQKIFGKVIAGALLFTGCCCGLQHPVNSKLWKKHKQVDIDSSLTADMQIY